MKELLSVSLRQAAVFVPNANPEKREELRGTTATLVANLAKLGYGVSEDLLDALNNATPAYQATILEKFREVMGVKKNWTPLVKAWNIPTGEELTDYIMTFFASIFQAKGTRLPCGHIIPPGTFPLERYNGCPYCKTPFEKGEIEAFGQGSKLKILELWTEKSAESFYRDLLESKTALDATQMASLKVLSKTFPLPKDISIGVKETLVAVVDILIEKKEAEKASVLFTSPTDILRYLWYKHTGFLQIIEPKTILKRKVENNKKIGEAQKEDAKAKEVLSLKLKYNRAQCRMVAFWLNDLGLEAKKACEIMHPKRQMWVRFIRALRLAEYSKKPGFENLKELLDVFYNQKYTVWQGLVDKARLNTEMDKTLSLLKQRPGMFARSLFSNMLWFGAEGVLKAFAEVIDKVPARLVFTLNMYAENYFDRKQQRSVKALGGVNKRIPANHLLELYTDEDLENMKKGIEDLCLLAMRNRFAALETESKTIFIAPSLYKIPVSIGDRSDTVQDMPSTLMGTRFPVEGETVRLFMQWGEGLPAQHLDMDLSCHVAYPNKRDICSYGRLTTTGCQHSGDITHIPEKVGTAEYIEIDLPTLQKEGAKYVTFTCNAYSRGEITPNLIVGWMSSANEMTISEKTGVAYDPSCVQQQVKITKTNLAKGLVFGILDIEAKEVVWLEMAFHGQVVQNLDQKGVEALLTKLDSKLSVGNLLKVKAEAQNLTLWEEETDAEGNTADEVYTPQWAINSAAVTKLLVD